MVDEGNSKEGIKFANSDEKIAAFVTPNNKKLVFGRPRRTDLNAKNLVSIVSFFELSLTFKKQSCFFKIDQKLVQTKNVSQKFKDY